MPIDNYNKHGHERDYENAKVDELMIANIIETLKNPLLTKIMSEDEISILAQVVKQHVVSRAEYIYQRQDKISKTR